MSSTIVSPRSWSVQIWLAVTALALGALAVFGDPYGGGEVRIDSRELAAIVGGKLDHVTPAELADWIVQGKTDFRVLDLRSEEAYGEYHIPGAEWVPIAKLPEYPLYRNEKIVLYSDGGIHAAQGWFLLKAEGYPGAYILLGGLDAWKDEILFPALPQNATAEQLADFDRRKAVSTLFGGAPRTGAAADEEAPAVVMPKVEMPAMPVPAAAPARKKKEGC
jgi:rhodanese-related sulfurtransferase